MISSRTLSTPVRDGGVELVDVGVAPLGDLDALLAGAVGVGRRALLAVERLGEDARGGGLAGAARPGEQVRVRDLAVGDGVAAACARCAPGRRRRRTSADGTCDRGTGAPCAAFQVGVRSAEKYTGRTRHGGAARTRRRERVERTRTLGRGPYGCCLPALTRFETCRRPSPLEALTREATVYAAGRAAHHAEQAVYSAVSVPADSAVCSAG